MKIVEINASNYGSTGNIMIGITEHLRESGHEVLVCYPATSRNQARTVEGACVIGTRIGRNIGLNLSKWTGREDRLFRFATRKLLRTIDRFQPDVIHLHNIHGWYLNFPMLFDYIKRKHVRVVWTFHDCWPVTGHCPHFEMIGCDKWKTRCGDCPIYRDYPESRVDNSRRLHTIKKQAFLGVENLTIVTPSRWLADIAGQSYLKDYPVEVVHNGIDLDIFKPVPSDFRQRFQCENKKLLLGVAFGWNKRKGLDVLVRLAKDLDDAYQIVLVGTDEAVESNLPEKIIAIRRTHSREELAAIYSAADLLVNPTREDTFPTVNMEALACGTPVLTFSTGGSPEILDNTCGCVVRKDDYGALKEAVIRIFEKPFSAEDCRKRALSFSRSAMLVSAARILVPVDEC